MEGHQGMDMPVIVVAAAHCNQQKLMGNQHIIGVCRSARAMPGHHWN